MNRSSTSSRLLLLVALAGVFLTFTWLALKIGRIYSAAQRLQARQTEATTLLADGVMQVDPDALETLVLGVRQDVVTLQHELQPLLFLAPYVGWLPGIGPLALDAPHLLQMADAATAGAVYATTGLKPALAVLQQPRASDQSPLPQLGQALLNAQPQLTQTATEWQRLRTARAALAQVDIYPPQAQNALAMLDANVELIESALALAPLLPDLMGMGGLKTFLILAQNEDELRATGGFISGAGLLQIENGQIQSLTFEDASFIADWRNKSYDLPPDPLYRFMGLELFLFRDANYWPDFPTSAAKAIELYTYTLDNTPALDGVIAIDQRFVAQILGAVGAVNLAGIEQPVTQQNVVRFMRASWGTEEGERVTRAWLLERKAFMGELARAIQTKIVQEPDKINLLNLLRAILEAGRQRDFLFYLTNPTSQATIAQLGWDGSLANPTGQDILLALDTNMGYNKANAVMERSLNYHVQLAPQGGGEARLTLVYTHTGVDNGQPCVHEVAYTGNLQYQDLIDNCYWNYLRLYTPAGSALISATSHPAPADLFVTGQAWEGVAGEVDEPGDLTVFDNFLIVPRQQSVTSAYHYRLPAGVTQTTATGEWLYQLLLVKQAGAAPQTVQVSVTLPAGAHLISSTPAPTRASGATHYFDWTLDQDISLSLRYQPGDS